MLKRALGVSAVVGTVLLLINQGDSVIHGVLPPSLWWKVPLTYTVPFLVSLHSSSAAMRSMRGDGAPSKPQR